MAAIGIVLLLAGYGLGLNGYSLIRGYDMTLGSFWNPVHPGTWNTQVYTGTAVFPDGKTQGNPPGSGPGSGGAGKCPKGQIWDPGSKKCLQELP